VDLEASLAVVILNWNGQKWLEQFLPTVVKYSEPYRVVLADNASTDQSIEWTKSNFPNVEIVVNEQNGGFAKGYNDALKKIDAEFYLLLNSDVEVTPNWIEPLLKHMENPKIASIQPKVLSFNRRDEFEHAGASGGFIDKYHYPFCRGRLINSFEKDELQYDYVSNVFWTTGACMLVRSKVYWEVGGLDERFFAHMEEIDWCWKVQRAGYELLVEPKSVVYHVGGGTLNYENPRKTFLNFRNSLLMIHKNQVSGLWYVLFRRLILDGIAGLIFLFSGKFSHFIAVIKAHFSFYGLLSSSRVERKKWKHLNQNVSKGVYKGSLLWIYFVQKTKKFSEINTRRFL
jgi:GT2 family glycosyltransferase